MRTWLILIAASMSLFTTTALAQDTLSHGRVPIGERENARKATEEFDAGHYDAAAAIYEAMAEAHPGSLYAWRNLGLALFQANKLDGARDALRHAVDLDSKDAASLAALGITNYQLGFFRDAIDNLRVAVGLNPGDAAAHQFLGNACDKLGMKEEAKAEQKIASDLEEKESEAAKQPAPAQH